MCIDDSKKSLDTRMKTVFFFLFCVQFARKPKYVFEKYVTERNRWICIAVYPYTIDDSVSIQYEFCRK